VQTHIGAYHILHGVDLAVPKGQLTMLLGRNGAGKTTTLRTIMGLWHASQGRVRFGDKDITALQTPQIAGLGIAYVPENMGIFSDLTVKENMLLAARGAKNADADRRHAPEMDLQALPRGGEVLEPSGRQALGRAEADAGRLARHRRAARAAHDRRAQQGPRARDDQQHDRRLRRAQASGVTILLVEQNINFAQRLGDTVAVMDNGRVVHSGSMAAFSADAQLQQSLLGLAL
jgi:branched-chain amino acid transport system ATP-binding protein